MEKAVVSPEKRTWRIGSVPYLNAKPLTDLFESDNGGRASVVYAPPATLAEWLKDRSVDTALVSSIVALTSPGACVVPDISISSRGEVQSVRLFSQVPFHLIETLSLDPSSLTANLLARVILTERYGTSPHCALGDGTLEGSLRHAEAAVLIGDAGMLADASSLLCLDLGAEWVSLTEKPFVWALWVGFDRLTPELGEELLKSKTFGLSRLEEIAEREAERLQIDFKRCYKYLSEVIDYSLTPDHWEGLRLFGDFCVKNGLIPRYALPKVIAGIRTG
jgi:chorismate dehydratase